MSDPLQHWSSLSVSEEACLQNINNSTFLTDPCTNPACQEVCQKQEAMLSGMSASQLQKLLGHTIQPPIYDGGGYSGKPGSVIPFCYHGKKLTELLHLLKEVGNYRYEMDENLGYKFCREARLMVTDNGVCTTYNLPGYGLMKPSFKRVVSNIGAKAMTGSQEETAVPLHPDSGYV